MKRIIVSACMLAGLSLPLMAAGGEGGSAAMPGMKHASHAGSGMGAQRQRCAPVMHDYLWLDIARMGGWMRGGNNGARAQNGAARNGEAGNASSAAQNTRMSRRTRVVRLRHNGFPPRMGGGCPSCRARAGGMRRADVKDMAAAMRRRGENRAWRNRRRGGGASDPLLKKAAIWLETPDNLIHRIDPGKPGSLRFNARMWGQYRLFAHVEGSTRNNVRRAYFAFYDLFSHGDEVSPKQRPVLNGDGYWQGQPEFNLERVYENDRQRYRTQTGEEAKFRLTFRGQPVKGACVVMITQKDWRQARRTDENGEVSFFLIKETPNESGWRARRRSEKYLVVARHFMPASEGQEGLKGTRYVATRLLRVRPSRLEWESKSTAFLLASFTMVAAGAAIAIRRVRRRRFAREGGK